MIHNIIMAYIYIIFGLTTEQLGQYIKIATGCKTTAGANTLNDTNRLAYLLFSALQSACDVPGIPSGHRVRSTGKTHKLRIGWRKQSK